jgi:hypothetical protein
LFRTPAEFYVPNRPYDVAIVTTEQIPADLNAGVLLIFSSKPTDLDDSLGICIDSGQQGAWLEWENGEFPVFAEVVLFKPSGAAFLRLKDQCAVLGLRLVARGQSLFRIGYDLFAEVSFLLSTGQSPESAHVPTLEMHIALLRDCILAAGIPFVEIPPVPAGYDFIACLTHDVDFIGIRDHKFDHTMWGFLYRAIVGSTIDGIKGKLKWTKVLQNFAAAASLPLVHLGLRKDFWLEFDRYLELEKGLGSTFFFIPFKDHPGVGKSGSAPKRRAAKYDVVECETEIQRLAGHGCEIGLHGIDAWHTLQSAEAELSRIRQVAGRSAAGVRMHWLYFSEKSPEILERAGFSYDSTFGYNEAVGFRAGTGQVFCPMSTETLLELPLNIQDTAMFYPGRLGLSEENAFESCCRLMRSARRFGGVLTLNWHTRSLSPERLWGEFYAKLLAEFKTYRVWFATARQIVTWYRNRRALCFEQVEFTDDKLRVKITGPVSTDQPPFLMRVHHPGHKFPSDYELLTPECLDYSMSRGISNE